MKIKEKLSTLWIVVLFNMLFADILSIFIELEKGNIIDIIGKVETTMAVAAVVINIPILMIYFSRSLEYQMNKTLNIVAALLTIIFVIGGGVWMPHYVICAGIGVLVLIKITIIAYSYKVET